MSAKKVPGGDLPIAKRCAFVGHLMNAENTAAVIELLASIEADCAGVSAGTIRKQCQIKAASHHHQHLWWPGRVSDARQH